MDEYTTEELISQVYNQTGGERSKIVEALKKHEGHVVNASLDILGAGDNLLVDKEAESKRDNNIGKIEDIMKIIPPMVGALPPLCSFCGADGMETALKRCSRCKKNLYCSRVCQSIQWDEHKKYCLKI